MVEKIFGPLEWSVYAAIIGFVAGLFFGVASARFLAKRIDKKFNYHGEAPGQEKRKNYFPLISASVLSILGILIICMFVYALQS